MNTRITQAVAAVKAYWAEHGHWPALPSEFIERLPLSGADIERALEAGVLKVVFPPAGPTARLEAP